jgi:diadenosine tetraphosphate (Ap4A) HIT family hydrolase
MKSTHHFHTNHAIEEYSSFRDAWDTPLFESPSFVAIPTVGALIEGWLLIVPKIPCLSFAELPKPLFCEFETFLAEVAGAVNATFGSVSVFEHGPARPGNLIGCGVDYAHMHVLPAVCDLVQGAQSLAPAIQWRSVNSIADIQQFAGSGSGYWFVKPNFNLDDCYIGTCDSVKPVSQLFRRIIANHLGKSHQFDWKLYSGESIIAATVEKISQHVIHI